MINGDAIKVDVSIWASVCELQLTMDEDWRRCHFLGSVRVPALCLCLKMKIWNASFLVKTNEEYLQCWSFEDIVLEKCLHGLMFLQMMRCLQKMKL